MAEEKPQLDKFKEAARELECDDNEQHFKEKLRKLVQNGARKNTDGDEEGAV